MMFDAGWEAIPSKLLSAEIDWQVDLDNPFIFHARHMNEDWTLRVNDFPEQIMFSLLKDEQLVAEFDDRPLGWRMHRRP
jgi:hypothetical protein